MKKLTTLICSLAFLATGVLAMLSSTEASVVPVQSVAADNENCHLLNNPLCKEFNNNRVKRDTIYVDSSSSNKPKIIYKVGEPRKLILKKESRTLPLVFLVTPKVAEELTRDTI